MKNNLPEPAARPSPEREGKRHRLAELVGRLVARHLSNRRRPPAAGEARPEPGFSPDHRDPGK
ncbi:hypothetical protein [Zavarzinella formosa]|uniref:hypothetical protein n=1 Tax=Zavarzinella formosa TaxID=360055 RepID=UPI0002F60C9E|nr:hypothetical protein [Zavarzinella formosa]